MTDIATIWRDEVAARAQRAQAAVAAGQATQAQAASDAHTCTLITRHFFPSITAASLLAGPAQLIDDLTPPARLYYRITRPIPALRTHGNWAWVEVDKARWAIWQALRWAGRVRGDEPPANWRVTA